MENKNDCIKCNCTTTDIKKGEKGSWCVSCGIKVFEVEERKCGDCKNYRKVFDGSICVKKLMSVNETMNVTYKVLDGSCFE